MVTPLAFIHLAGGLCLFLLGMHLLSRGLEKFAGARLQDLIERLTNRPVKGFLVGIATTAALQSSSLTIATIIGLINAGLMTFSQAIGIILGAEIGTTITVQIIAFNVWEFYAIPLIIGFLVFFVSKRLKYKFIGQGVLGFGILLMGMSLMSTSMAPLADEPAFRSLLAYMGVNIPLAILSGVIFTAIIQSSAAVIGTVIVLSMTGVIGLPAAIGIVLGANVGTCIKFIIISWKSSLSAKRAAFSHLFISVVGVLAFAPFVYQYASLIQLTSPSISRQIANAHTLFNVIVATTLLPFSGYIVRFVKRAVPGDEEAVVDIRTLSKSDIMKSPELTLRYAEEELKKVLKMTVNMLKCAEKALLNADMAAVKDVVKTEPHIDRLWYFIENLLNKASWIDATEEQLNQRMRIFHNTTDMERVGDLALNIAQYAREKKRNNIPFSGKANAELHNMFRKVTNAYVSAVRSVITINPVLARKAMMSEEEVDKLYWKYRENHIKRLQAGTCDPRAEEIFTNSLRDLERVSDHADNLADSILIHLGITDLE